MTSTFLDYIAQTDQSEVIANYLSDISPHDRKWDGHKSYSDIIADIYRDSAFERYVTRINKCADYLVFAQNADNQLKLHTAFFCRVPQCNVCQWRRSAKLRMKMFKVLPEILHEYPDSRFLFLTLGVRNCSIYDLRETLVWMSDAWKKLFSRRTFPYQFGFIRSAEVTRNYDCYYDGVYLGRHPQKWVSRFHYDQRSNPSYSFSKFQCLPTTECHPHFHIILVVPKSYFDDDYRPHEYWLTEWQSALKVDYRPTAHIKAIKEVYASQETEVSIEDLNLAGQFGLDVDFDDIPSQNFDISHQLTTSILETIKYSVKPSDLVGEYVTGSAADGFTNQDWLVELTSQLFKMRRFASGGIFKDKMAELNDEEKIDMIGKGDHTDEFVINDIAFSWLPAVKRYGLQYTSLRGLDL